MKIAHITATFPPYRGGTGVVCFYNALHLAKRGHQVTVLTAEHPQESEVYPPELIVKHLPVRFRFGNAPLLQGLYSEIGNYDLLHLHYPFVFGQEQVYLRALLRKTRYVITYHQDIIFPGVKGKLVDLHHTFLGRVILGRANRLLVTSKDYAQSARIAPLMKRMGERVVDMPNGVDSNRFHPTVRAGNLHEKYNLKPEDKIVLFVGGLDSPHYFKGVDVLLRSIHKIDDSTIKLVVVGDGDLRPQYTAQAHALGIQDRVTFCGYISDEDLPAHYALCDVLVLPSTTMGEAFGIVLLEAMATGKPVIASNLPGVRSVVNDGEDGLLVHVSDADDLAQKIANLLENADRRQQMGICGRQKVESTYAWERIIDRLEHVYEEVLR